jgi:hypothetical protein
MARSAASALAGMPSSAVPGRLPVSLVAAVDRTFSPNESSSVARGKGLVGMDWRNMRGRAPGLEGLSGRIVLKVGDKPVGAVEIDSDGAASVVADTSGAAATITVNCEDTLTAAAWPSVAGRHGTPGADAHRRRCAFCTSSPLRAAGRLSVGWGQLREPDRRCSTA